MGYIPKIKHGEELFTNVQCVDDACGPKEPIDAPVATIISEGSVVASVPLVKSKAPLVGLFELRFVIGTSLPLGKLLVVVRWKCEHTALPTPHHGRMEFSFDLEDGGDTQGRVISMYSFTRPDGRFVVAQTSQGRIFRGKNPKVNP